MKDITLHAKWLIKAPLTEVFNIMTDFEKFPEYFPKVAESIQIMRHGGNNLEIDATVNRYAQRSNLGELYQSHEVFDIIKIWAILQMLFKSRGSAAVAKLNWSFEN